MGSKEVFRIERLMANEMKREAWLFGAGAGVPYVDKNAKMIPTALYVDLKVI